MEAALILPVLLLLILGIIDLSRAYNAKQALTHASREAIRTYVVTEDYDLAAGAFYSQVVALDGADLVSIEPDPCDPGEAVTATATYTFRFAVLKIFKNGIPMDTVAVMRCGG